MSWPSVTQVLGPFVDWSAIPEDVLRNAADRGSRVHRLCAADLQGFPVLNGDPETSGYYMSFYSWRADYVSDVVMVEERLSCEKFKFTGKPDAVVKLVNGKVVLVDLKTPAVESKTWKGQLAAYFHLCWVNDIRVDYAMALMLRKDGRPPKGIPYIEGNADWAAFLSALNAYRYFTDV